MSNAGLERGRIPLRGGEADGHALGYGEALNHLIDALLAERYGKARQVQNVKEADLTYSQNQAFWLDALYGRHFPSANIVLEDFHITEWLPFAPGRYFTPQAVQARENALQYVARDRDEYLPSGKYSMVSGGIGAIRLGEKQVDSDLMYFLGASSNGIAHQGIPIALPGSEYKRVISQIKDRGGCRARLVGKLRTMTDELPKFAFERSIPRYCFFADEAKPTKPSGPQELITTTAIMYGVDQRYADPSLVVDKSWTFCSFNPGASKEAAQTAASWLYDYATRYSHKDPKILTDFDEHYSLFACHVEFPLTDIVRGKVDWETLRAYDKVIAGTYIKTYIGTYIAEQINVAGDNFKVIGSGNTIVSRSKVQNAFNRVQAAHNEDVAKALVEIEEAINKSGSKEAAENFDSFSDELGKPAPKKSLLKTLWQGTLEALPALKELPDVISKVSGLFA